jgi:hypothetical protein
MLRHRQLKLDFDWFFFAPVVVVGSVSLSLDTEVDIVVWCKMQMKGDVSWETRPGCSRRIDICRLVVRWAGPRIQSTPASACQTCHVKAPTYLPKSLLYKSTQFFWNNWLHKLCIQNVCLWTMTRCMLSRCTVKNSKKKCPEPGSNGWPYEVEVITSVVRAPNCAIEAFGVGLIIDAIDPKLLIHLSLMFDWCVD